MQRRSFLVATGALAGCASGPGEPGKALSRIALASCIDQTEPQPIWRQVLAAQPQLMVFAGDNVYASEQPWSRTRLDTAYAQLASNPDFARLRSAVPAVAIWDDHDYGLNDGGEEFAHKQSSKDAFLAFWQTPQGSERRRREGLYDAQVFGPPGQRVQVILLDARWFRSALMPTPMRQAPGMERYVPDADPAKTMLGDAQWAWLEQQLRQPAELRLLVSGVQVLAEGHGYERWGNLPLQRQRLFDTIARTRAAGVVFVSGDRHIGGLYRETAGTPYPLYEITSSGITHTARNNREPGPNRLGAAVTELHFGLVDVDWAARRVLLSLRGADGRTLHQHAIALEELKPL
jgi:alkaline phosphatase D